MDNREDVGEYYPGGTVVPAKPEPAAHPVESVNGKTGAVVLTAEDVGALPATTEIPDAEKVSAWGFLKKAWSDLVEAFAAKTHRHTIGQVDGLQSELSTLDQKATETSDLAAAAQSTANSANENAAAAMDKANELDTAKADKSALNAHTENTNNPHKVTADQVDAVPFVVDSRGNKTAVTIGSRKIGSSVGEGSFAAGFDVSAIGPSSHAEGIETTAYEGAHAEGVGTTAMGYYSHAEGQNTTAIADGSHTDGIYSITLRYHDGAFVWNGDGSKSENNPYTSHGYGTFNINPDGGLGGFWIGEQTLEAIINAAVKDKADLTAIRTALASLDAAKSSIADIINALKGI